jgi:hypothetical protein
MSRSLDLLLAGLAVLAAVAYAAHALAPRAWRNRLYARLGFKTGTSGAGCGGCGSCGDTPTTSGKVTEVGVPLKSIQRRK